MFTVACKAYLCVILPIKIKMDSLIIYILFVWCKLHMYIVKCYVNCVSYNIIVMMLKNKKKKLLFVQVKWPDLA